MNREVFEQAIEHFDAPREANVADLRAFTHGAKPTAVDANLAAFAREWQDSGVDAWNQLKHPQPFREPRQTGPETESFGWWHLPELIGDRFIAPLIGAQQGTSMMMPNATSVVGALLSCKELNQSGRREVATTDGEFSAVDHPLSLHNAQFAQYPQELRDAVGFRIQRLNLGTAPFSAEDLNRLVSEETALVVVSHVGFLRGERIPDKEIQEVVRHAHERGVLVAIDGYHAIGSTIDVEAMGVDVYFGGLLKEGCGSSGNGFLYVRPGLDLNPSTGGWFGAADPFGFHAEYQASPVVRRRFLSGTPAVASLYHGAEGVRTMLEIGYPAVVQDIREKALFLQQGLRDAGARIVSPEDPNRMSALVVAEVDSANNLRDHLGEQGVHVDARLDRYLRMAPHVYNSPEQLEHAVWEMTSALASKQYLQRSTGKRSGPVT